MFNYHKRKLTTVRQIKSQNFNKDNNKIIVSGTGNPSLLNIKPLQQYLIDEYDSKIDTHTLKMSSTTSLVYTSDGKVKRDDKRIPSDWFNTHDKTRWSKSANATKKRNRDRDNKMLLKSDHVQF